MQLTVLPVSILLHHYSKTIALLNVINIIIIEVEACHIHTLLQKFTESASQCSSISALLNLAACKGYISALEQLHSCPF